MATKPPQNPQILVRLEVRCITAEQDGDRLVNEQAGPAVFNCYSEKDLVQLYRKALEEVRAANAVAATANRAARRSKPKKKGGRK